jgi:uncharacterized membrane-anchored protein
MISSNVEKTKPSDENIFIKGKVVDVYNDEIHIIYGIEDYFIPEGTGRDFTFLREEIAAKVEIDENGNAVLKQIYVNDKPWP